jgi:2,4-dienoyl-CoA reductase-like NADH-dependent reductase (Old Yellow Enzyme family)
MINESLHPLLQPRSLRDLLVPNRVVIASLTHGQANDSEHVADDLVRQYDEQRATVGRGVENVKVGDEPGDARGSSFSGVWCATRARDCYLPTLPDPRGGRSSVARREILLEIQKLN